MTNVEIFRPTSNIVMALVTFVMSALMAITMIWQGGQRDALIAVAWAATASSIAYLVFWRPKVILFDEGITIVNPFLTITAGWDLVDAIDAKYTMSLLIADKTIYAWAAPAPSRYHSRSIHETELRGMRFNDQSMIRPGESPRSHSGAATYLARTKLENFRNSNLVGAASKVDFNKVGITTLLTSITTAMVLTYFQF